MKVDWTKRLCIASSFSSIVNPIGEEDFLKLKYKEKIKLLNLYENKFGWNKAPKKSIKQCPSVDTCELINSFLEKDLTESELWENYRKMGEEIKEKEKFILDWKEYIKNMEEDLLALQKSKDELFDSLLHMKLDWQ